MKGGVLVVFVCLMGATSAGVRDACASDGDCSGYFPVCSDGYCSEMTCSVVGDCATTLGFAADSCTDGSCVYGCTSLIDCVTAAHAVFALGACVNNQCSECAVDTDCTTPSNDLTKCVSGTCYECVDDDDCTGDDVCTNNYCGASAPTDQINYQDPYPDTPTITVDTDDSNLYEDVVAVNISVTPSGTVPVCGFDIKIGLSDTDMTGPVVHELRESSGYPTGAAVTVTLTDVITRVVPSGTTLASVYPVLTTTSTNGVDYQSLAPSTVFLSDASSTGVYKIQAFAINCEVSPAINPTPGVADLTDIAIGSYAPLLGDSRTSDVFTFTDTEPTVGEISGTLELFVDMAGMANLNIDGFRVYAGTKCDSLPGCDDADTTVDEADFSVSASGTSYTATLSNFAMTSGNQLYIAPYFDAADGTTYIGAEREIRVIDLWPAASGDLLGATTTAMADYTPEKAIDTDSLALRYADQLLLDLSPNWTAPAIDPSDATVFAVYQWQVDPAGGTDFVDISQATSATYGPRFMLPSYAGNYRATAYAYDYTSATPFVTELYVSDTLDVTVDDYPQPPEGGIPNTLAFTDTDTRAGFVGGDLTFEETTYLTGSDTRQFEYYLIYLSPQDACVDDGTAPGTNTGLITCDTGTGRLNTDTRLGVVTYSPGAKTFTITNAEAATTTADWYIHITAYETAGLGAQSASTATINITDVAAATPQPPPSVTSAGFYDYDGAARSVAGLIEFGVTATDDYSDVDKFVVYLHTSSTFSDSSELGPLVASIDNPGTLSGTETLSIWLGTFDNTFGAEEADPETSTALTQSSVHYSHLLVLSQTSAAMGSVLSTTGAPVEIDDRIDSYYFLNMLVENTDLCPVEFCPSGTPTTGNMFWPYAEQSVEGSGMVSVYWLTASLSNMIYNVDPATRAGELMDNTALMDLSGMFNYRVALGNSATSPECILGSQSTWPHGAPDQWLQQGDMTQRELFFMQADYDGLLACGFTEMSTKADINLQGIITLYLDSTRSDAVGSTIASTEPQLVIQANMQVSFQDETHAVVASVSVDNMLVVEGTITSDVTLESDVSFYSEAFLSTLDPATSVFSAGSDVFYLEHVLLSNADTFYIDLQRMWFSSGMSISDDIEYLVPSSDGAFTNIDNPALPGRYRSESPVPYLMNCKPCYMHVVSAISNSVPTKKLLTMQKGDEVTRSAKQIFVDSSRSRMVESDSAASCARTAFVGSVAALVFARM